MMARPLIGGALPPGHWPLPGTFVAEDQEPVTRKPRACRPYSAGICAAHGAQCEVDYTHEFAPTVNWPDGVAVAVAAAEAEVGNGDRAIESGVERDRENHAGFTWIGSSSSRLRRRRRRRNERLRGCSR